MDFVLLAVAEILLLGAGLGMLLLIAPPEQDLSAAEVFGLSILLGAALVSLASFGLGLVLSNPTLRLTLTLVCLIIAVVGIAKNGARLKRISLARPRVSGLIITTLLALEAGIFAWVAFRVSLGWDGLVVWDIKATTISMNGGAIPISYFTDQTRSWSQLDYPLFFPLNESWIYTWLGRSSQGLVKLVSVVFFVAAQCLLYAGGTRFGGRLKGFLAAVLLLFIPLIVMGEGSATSGYADFPLAVCYLATVIYLLEYWERGTTGSLRILGSLAAILPWIKQEGIILWLCLLALVAVRALQRRELKRILLMLPGAVVFAGWGLFLKLVNAKRGTAFLPFSLKTFWTNRSRLPVIAQAVVTEMVNWDHWSILWLGVALSLMVLFLVRRRQQSIVLLGSILMPLIIYSVIYVFSAWNPFMLHVTTSLSRLLLQLSLVCVLTTVMALRMRGVSFQLPSDSKPLARS